MDRHRGDRYGGNQGSPHHYRQSRGPSRFSDGPINHHARSPKGYRGGFSAGPGGRGGGGGGGPHRAFDSPPRHPMGGGGNGSAPPRLPMGGNGGGGPLRHPMGGGGSDGGPLRHPTGGRGNDVGPPRFPMGGGLNDCGPPHHPMGGGGNEGGHLRRPMGGGGNDGGPLRYPMGGGGNEAGPLRPPMGGRGNDGVPLQYPMGGGGNDMGPLRPHMGGGGDDSGPLRHPIGAGGNESGPLRHPMGEGGKGGGHAPFQLMGPVSGRGGGGYSSNFEVPLTGQKRGFPFNSPDRFDGSGFAKLFVGSVPRTATEEQIRPLFEDHGHVIEVALIKDKRTGQQQGCCFIKYASSEEAERAIRALHNQYTLPGGVGPIQVRYADGERERLGTTEFKLFVGSLSKQATEKEVEEIFSPYGRVEDVYLMRDEMKQSRGCGFVKFSHRDMAMAAINALNGIYTMRGCDQPLIVRFADPKRPRPGDSRGAPAFGGPGFGPRFPAPGIRPTPDLADTIGGHMPASAWHQRSPENLGLSSNATNQGFGHPSVQRGGDGPTSSVLGGFHGGLGGPPDGSVPGHSVASTPVVLQNHNQPLPQAPSVGQQISPVQKSLQSPQNLPHAMQPHPQGSLQTPVQSQPSNALLRQPGPLQIPHSASQVPVAVPPQQQIGQGARLSVSQPRASSAAAQQNSLNIKTEPYSVSALGNQQQLPAPGQQQVLQPVQQSPSQLAQLLSQQTQALQASFQSSQQAFSQLQQQLQLMQPSNQGGMPLQGSQASKQQSQWPGGPSQSIASTPAITPRSDVPSNSSVAPAVPVINQGTASIKCNWSEHTSPDGYKYYYNSVTGESRWEKPEELVLHEQQEQKPSVLQTQKPLPSQVLSMQQIPQAQQVQVLTQQQQQQQPALSSSYQVSGAVGQQNLQDVNYSKFQSPVGSVNGLSRFQQNIHAAQGSAAPVNDSSRFQQGIQAAQEWMWKNKPAA